MITQLTPRTRRARAGGAGLILALMVAAMTVLPSLAQEQPPPIRMEPVAAGAAFTDGVDIQIKNKLDGSGTTVLNMRHPSNTVVARFIIQPGAQFPWHTHPGPVIVNVTQGELVYVQASDCVERRYSAGAAFVDPGRGNVHTAFNPDDGETIIVATFFEVVPGGPLSITDVTPGDCDIEVGTHAGH